MGLPKGLNLIEHNGQTLAKLYSTMIVIVDNNGPETSIKLNSGGWSTKHTKKCMNLILNKHGVYVYQKDFQWYVNTPKADKLQFTDGMTFKI